MSTIAAALDIGTNSVLLLVVRAEGGGLVRLHERCAITRLGEGVDASGELDAGAVARTLAALQAMVAEMGDLGVDRVGAIGTAVLRRVTNGERFTRAAEALLGCPIEVVSGRREAELVVVGVIGALGSQPPGTVIFDVGGGSTELVLVGGADGPGRGAVELSSLELGAVRLTERYLGGDPPLAAELEVARAEVSARLGELPATFDPRPATSGAEQALVGVAGTVTTLATVKLALAEYDTEQVNGLPLERGEIAAQIACYAGMALAERRAIVGLEPQRADVILGGALIVDGVLEHFGAERLRVCDRGVRWGLARELVRQ